MRVVSFKRKQKGADNLIETVNCVGHFHNWGTDLYETNEGSYTYTVAIVEMPDGEVLLLNPIDIKFEDKPQ